MTERVRATIEKVRGFMEGLEDAWSLPEESARFVHASVLACRSKHCVEIGTSYGHSGLWIGAAAAVNGGHLITLEKEQRKADIANGFFRDAGLEGVITCKVGIAADIISNLSGPVDWVLNDADKENCIRYVELLHPRMPVGGVALTDNVNSNEVVSGQFIPWIRANENFITTLVPVGNGIEFSVKVA